MADNPIVPTVDLEADGVRHGHLRLPHSDDASAWGAVMIPIAVVANGAGPTALFTGGNHGDEYEGPVALMQLARALDPAAVRGRVILVPMMNHPAVRAARRTSPLDAGNLNRAFPGRPDGTPTEKIADYFQRTLLPRADLVLDLHSGGKTLEFVPLAAAHALPDPAQQARCEAAMLAFGAPYAALLHEQDSAGMYDGAAEALGKTFVTTELGGAGTATARSVAIARRGAENLLKHAGILDGDPEPPPEPTVRLAMPGNRCFVVSDAEGLVEPCVDLGEPIAEGQVVARVHDVTRTGAAPVDHRARLAGLLAGRHVPGLTRMGDTLAVIAVPEP